MGCGAGAGAEELAALLSAEPPFGFDVFEPAGPEPLELYPVAFESAPAVFEPEVFDP
jgi:hypothetical protein